MVSRTLDLKHFPTNWLRKLRFEMSDLPMGWLGSLDATVLYSMATLTKGPMLEIGSWVGRSTCSIAFGLRDVVAFGRPLPRFDSVDFGITGAIEARERFPDIDPYAGPMATTMPK